MRKTSEIADQDAVAAFLGDPRTHGGQPVERHDTHASIVFVAGERACKMKRAVRYPYLDYSTLSLRRAACAAEVQLNRRTAPNLYLGIAAVTGGRGGQLRLAEIGANPADAVEWLVVMRRFDETTQFDRLAEREALTPALMRELADAIAAFHRAAEPCPSLHASQALGRVIDGNIEELAVSPDLFLPDNVDGLRRHSEEALTRLAPLLERRAEQGRVRRCHGDLHLRNICLVDDRPTLFDAIEFDEAIATVDVLYDLAFLLMDLEYRDLRPCANVVLNRYLELTDEFDGLAALPLFLATRAAVRAKVEAARARQVRGDADPGGTGGNYLALALGLLDPESPRLIGVGGLSGTGKTALARRLAPWYGAAPGAVIVRSDVVRKQLAGVAETIRLPSEAYTPAMARRVYDAVFDRTRRALSAGRAVIADAVFADPGERDALKTLARALNVPFAGLWLDADPKKLLARIAVRQGDASDATAIVVQRQLQYDLGRLTWQRLDASDPLDDVMTAARLALG